MVYQVSSSVRFKGLLGDPSMFIASNPELFGSHKYILKPPGTISVVFPHSNVHITPNVHINPNLLV